MTQEQLTIELRKARVFGSIDARDGFSQEIHISEKHPDLAAFKRLAKSFGVPLVANGHVPVGDIWMVKK